MTELTLRSLYPEDIAQVAKIESSLTGTPRRVFLEKRLAVATAMPDSFITCAAVDNGRLVCYGFARILEGEFGARSAIAVLDDIGVDPEYRGKGIGKKVLAGIERRMKNKRIDTLQTMIDWRNHSMIRFFAATAFDLAPGQIIGRDTSPLNNDFATVVTAEADGSAHFVRGGGGVCSEKAGVDDILVRPLGGGDIATIDRIDTKLTGLDRSAYYACKFREMLDESEIRVSLVAERHGVVAGFIMARVDYGEFGNVAKSAVIDSIGVHPEYSGSGVGHALLSQLLINLAAFHVKSVRTKIEYENCDLRNFLSNCGFKPSQSLLLTKKIQ